MILVDTSVWIDFLMGRDTTHAKAVESLVETREDICICGVILTEILQGIRNDKEHYKTKAILSELVFIRPQIFTALVGHEALLLEIL